MSAKASLATYVRRLVHDVKGQCSAEGCGAIESIVKGLAHKVGDEVVGVLAASGAKTVTLDAMLAATRLTFIDCPGTDELVREMQMAVARYEATSGGSRETPVSAAARADVITPPTRAFDVVCHTHKFARVSMQAKVAAAALVDFLIAALVDPAVEEAAKAGHARITGKDVSRGVAASKMLGAALGDATIRGGMTMGQVHAIAKRERAAAARAKKSPRKSG